MSDLAPLLARNPEVAAVGRHQGLTPMPAHQVFVISCIDGRTDPTHYLGLEPGDALVLRNAGGRVTDEAVEEVAFIATVTEHLLGDGAPGFEVAVIHHTGCGTGLLADPGFQAAFGRRLGLDDPASLAPQAVTDPHQTVAADVERLRSSPLVPDRVTVSGHVYDVDTGLVTTVAPAAPATAAPDPAG